MLEDLWTQQEWFANLPDVNSALRPHVEDLKEPPMLIVQLHPQHLSAWPHTPPRRDRLDSARLSARCPHHFALVDAVGIQIINYEGPIEFRHVPPKQFNMAWFHMVLLNTWFVGGMSHPGLADLKFIIESMFLHFMFMAKWPHPVAKCLAAPCSVTTFGPGRQLSTIKMSGLRYEHLNHQTLSGSSIVVQSGRASWQYILFSGYQMLFLRDFATNQQTSKTTAETLRIASTSRF